MKTNQNNNPKSIFHKGNRDAMMIVLMLILMASRGYSQPIEIKLKYSQDPIPNEINGPEVVNNGIISNISEAKIYVYLPPAATNTGAAVLICPGGGYSVECSDYEGSWFAEWLNKQGIAGIVLKYRLPNKKPMIPLVDAITAMETVRLNATKWNINPNKIGIAGFSAGGHLASTLATHFRTERTDAENPLDRVSSRPDFQVLLYPVISMHDELTHKGSRDNLLGENPESILVDFFSNEGQVSQSTPPAFITLANDDVTVSPQNSIAYYTALENYKIPAELHIFNNGGHGFGMQKTPLPVSQWPQLLIEWLKAIQIIPNTSH